MPAITIHREHLFSMSDLGIRDSWWISWCCSSFILPPGISCRPQKLNLTAQEDAPVPNTDIGSEVGTRMWQISKNICIVGSVGNRILLETNAILVSNRLPSGQMWCVIDVILCPSLPQLEWPAWLWPGFLQLQEGGLPARRWRGYFGTDDLRVSNNMTRSLARLFLGRHRSARSVSGHILTT